MRMNVLGWWPVVGEVALLLLTLGGCEARDSGADNVDHLVGDKQIQVYKLYEAVKRNDVATVKQALDNGMSPNTHMRERSTLLSVAAGEGHLEMARFLISRGANVDYQSVDPYQGGATPLILAVMRNDCPMMKVLLQAGADPKLKFLNAGNGGLGQYTDLNAQEIYEYEEKTSGRDVCSADVKEMLFAKK